MTTTAPVSPQAFASSWGQYLEILEEIGRRQLRRNESEVFRRSFLPLYNQVFARLRSSESLNAIEAAVTGAIEEDEANAEPIEFLMQELLAYNGWQTPTVASDATRVYRPPLNIDDYSHVAPERDETSHALAAGRTIKDSLESLLGKWIWNPVRKVLGIVNELLSIVRGGS